VKAIFIKTDVMKKIFFVIAALCPFLVPAQLAVKSLDFANNNYIPVKFTCDGGNLSPGLKIENIPAGAKSLALITDDTDSPNGPFVHWVLWNIPLTGKIAENKPEGIQGLNSANQNKYFGPCPPNGIHTYHFKIYALDITLDIAANSGKKELLSAMEGHILSSAELLGRYKR
jgi:hypothetical protein